MQFGREALTGIESGEITLAFRRWKRAAAKSGSRVRTAAGVVRIGEVSPREAGSLTKADAQASGFASLDALLEMLGPDDGGTVYRIKIDGIEPDERAALRDNAEPTDAEWQKIRSSFVRWEESAAGHFPAILQLIRAKPETAAGSLAGELGQEKLKFKQDVRKLKELGLTESLDIGYRLSPRGTVVLRWLEDGGA